MKSGINAYKSLRRVIISPIANTSAYFRLVIQSSIVFCAIVYFSGCGGDFAILEDSEFFLLSPATLYWTEAGKTVNSIVTDGSNKKVILSVPGTPLDLAFYAPQGRIYWAEYSTLLTEYEINSALLDGTGAANWYSKSSTHGPTTIAIDGGAGILYWNEYQGQNRIMRSTLVPLSKVQWENTIADTYTYSLCIDTIHRKSYFTANSYWEAGPLTAGSGNTGGVYMGSLDTANTKATVITGTGPVATSIPFRGIVVDGWHGLCFYASNTTGTTSIIKTDLNLQNPVVWVTAAGFDIEKLALDANGGKIYWTSESDSSIYRVDANIKNSAVEKFLQLGSIPTGISIYP